MNEDFQRFVDSLESPNSARVAKSVRALGEHDYSKCSLVELEQIILDMKPNSERAITTICYILGAYARFLGDDRLYRMALDVDRKLLWKLAKPSAPKKYISYNAFKDVYYDIGVLEDFNTLYYKTLFMSVYEGIYNEDMSVVKNLRASDIHGNIVTLHEDNGHSYDLEISQELADNLKKMGNVNVWERENKFGVHEVSIDGLYYDSCFKCEIRKEKSKSSYKFSYYRVLRKISTEYIGYKIMPVQLYVSGLMYRIESKLAENGITLEEAFAVGNKSRVVSSIISEELERCNCNTVVRNFREMVIGHIDTFTESDERE